MYVRYPTELPGTAGEIYAQVFNPPPGGHLIQLGPATATPFRAFFLCIAMLSRCNVVHVLDDLVTLASGGFETIPVENDDFAAVVTDQLA